MPLFGSCLSNWMETLEEHPGVLERLCHCWLRNPWLGARICGQVQRSLGWLPSRPVATTRESRRKMNEWMNKIFRMTRLKGSPETMIIFTNLFIKDWPNWKEVKELTIPDLKFLTLNKQQFNTTRRFYIPGYVEIQTPECWFVHYLQALGLQSKISISSSVWKVSGGRSNGREIAPRFLLMCSMPSVPHKLLICFDITKFHKAEKFMIKSMTNNVV